LTIEATGPALSQRHIEAIEARGISAETAVRLGLFTARNTNKGVVQDVAGDVLVFPYVEHGDCVNEKYRAPGKKFWQRDGGKRTFWNSDVLDDPTLITGEHFLIITEGELDALAAIDCGFPLTVSVPDGAPNVPNGKKPDDLDPLDEKSDYTGKFEFVFNNSARLKKIKKFLIATDSDPPGQRLAAELVRRLRASKCMFVSYPDGCKDLNDVLKMHGRDAVADVINSAKPYPVRGYYHLDDLPPLDPIETFSCGWPTLDKHIKMFVGEFMVVTGIPSMGKSTWVMNLLVNMYRNHGWRSAVFSPEMPMAPHLRDKFRRIIGGAFPDNVIQHAIGFIGGAPSREDEEDYTIEWLIGRATEAVFRDGIRILVVDPWNEMEHARDPGESVTEYTNWAIKELKRFARQYEVAVIVICHPTKDVFDKGKTRTPTLYDCDGSAAWFNKCDHGICIHRPDPQKDETLVNVLKVRFDDTGEKGSIKFGFDRASCQYHKLDEPPASQQEPLEKQLEGL
jgi:twinkle protein